MVTPSAKRFRLAWCPSVDKVRLRAPRHAVDPRRRPMISFACKKCARTHRRPEGQAGTLVFCDCGQANRVPWATEVELVPPAQPRPVLDAQPVPPATPPLPSRRPGRLLGKVNPNFCFHHLDDPSTAACAACRLPFCDACVVLLRGETLCGPCKNFRVASPGRARRVLPLAVIAL